MTSIPTPAAKAGGLAAWEPENAEFWAARGARVANRTLWITTGSLTLSFATWFMWSAIVVRLPELGFPLSVGQRFWLTALPGLVGATLRIPYSFVVQIFGTRSVVTFATATLLVPSVGVGLAVQDPQTPYWVLLTLAASAGFGGGNFAAFMSSTSFFFPKAKQGTALGIQAGLGNFGVSLVQFLTPAVIGASIFGATGGEPMDWAGPNGTKSIFIQNAAFIWVLPVAFFTIAAALGLKSIPVKATMGEQSVIFRRKHNWLMTSLYMMTFGSFSGLSAAFALLIREVFGKVEGAPDPLKFAFLGALIGSTTRPIAGWVSDKVGGAKVTILSGLLLLGGSIAITAFTAPHSASDFWPFLAIMLVLFLGAGIGNGSTFRMIPVIFPPKEAGPVLGWTSAAAAYGSFILPMLFSWSLGKYASVNAAFIVLAVFYAANLAICWWFYTRRGAEVRC
ncbi:MAG: MFS transporter [Deltaproteobacteria bacterium]|nr:MFS transporter [Deltaproteobacteria bacterium]